MADLVEFTQQLADYYEVPVAFAMPREKVTQKSVKYRKADPEAHRRCGTCVMYHASKCDLVEGYIRPDHVCDRWEARPVDLALEQRHVRTARGVFFFHEPIGTPITEEEYQQLLAQRQAAKREHETGHPARVAAERAIRTARRMRSGPDADYVDTPDTDVVNPVAEEHKQVLADADRVLKGLQTQVSITQPSKKQELTDAQQRLKQLQAERQGRQTGRNANVVTSAEDKRISQGQTPSNFVHPDTGTMMSKSSIGDTYEQLFSTHGASLLERIYGKPYEMISHAQGGSRTTPLDFRLGSKYGGELKTMSASSTAAQRGKLKTAIKKEEIDRKHAALAKEKLQPLLVVQVVDQKTGTVDVYTHDAFASKFVKTMRHVGSYKYTKQDFRDAHAKAGYGGFSSASASQAPPDAMAARLTSDAEYQKLLDARKEAQRKYPVGHPVRVAAERAVRQARKQIHGAPEPPKPPAPKTPFKKVATGPAKPPVKPGWVYDPKTKTAQYSSGSIPMNIGHMYTWNYSDPQINRAFQQQAENAVKRQLTHQSKWLANLLEPGGQVHITITENPGSGAHSTALATYGGNKFSGQMNVSPKVFPHVVSIDGAPFSASFFLKEATPNQVLHESIKSGWWVPIDSHWQLSDAVIAHELGHAVHDALFNNPSSAYDRGIPQDAAFWDGLAKVIGVSAPLPVPSWSTEGAGTYDYNAVASWVKTNQQAIRRSISEYGSSVDQNTGLGKPREMLAELWAEHTMSSNPRAAARFYGAYVESHLAKNNLEAAKHAALLRDLPPNVAKFNPERQPIGTTETFPSLHMTVERQGPDKWEITRLTEQGYFQGSYGRKTAEEVTQLLKNEWVWINSGKKKGTR